jgi:large subunit ribosomal protein L15
MRRFVASFRNTNHFKNMLQLHTIKPNPGAKHRRKRLGNGESSGLGKTCGKGNKGQKARSGGTIRPGFEGGQMPLHRRLPKKGFNNARFQKKIAIVNIAQLEKFFEAGANVNEESLRSVKLVQGPCDVVKLLANGELTKSLNVTVDFASTAACEKVTQAGGTITKLSEA